MNNTIKKKSIVFLISDFMDEGYERILKVIGNKHDFIGVVLNDERENEIPSMGIVKFTDAETGEEKWIDTSNPAVQNTFREIREENLRKMKSLFLSSKLDNIEISTGDNYIKPLVQFFKMRERRW
jgi:glutaredoxin 2